MAWNDLSIIQSQRYICGHCGSLVAQDRGYQGEFSNAGQINRKLIYICPNCDHPTYFIYDDLNRVIKKIPSSSFGNFVEHLPDEVHRLYDEARRCTSNSSYTAAVMVCRKLLMHIAVEKGAEENKSFKEYVNHLDKGGYLPTKSEQWVNYIRNQGNEANHEIVLKNESNAKNLVELIEMLLKLIYEFPARTSSFGPEDD